MQDTARNCTNFPLATHFGDVPSGSTCSPCLTMCTLTRERNRTLKTTMTRLMCDPSASSMIQQNQQKKKAQIHAGIDDVCVLVLSSVLVLFFSHPSPDNQNLRRSRKGKNIFVSIFLIADTGQKIRFRIWKNQKQQKFDFEYQERQIFVRCVCMVFNQTRRRLLSQWWQTVMMSDAPECLCTTHQHEVSDARRGECGRMCGARVGAEAHRGIQHRNMLNFTSGREVGGNATGRCHYGDDLCNRGTGTCPRSMSFGHATVVSDLRSRRVASSHRPRKSLASSLRRYEHGEQGARRCCGLRREAVVLRLWQP